MNDEGRVAPAFVVEISALDQLTLHGAVIQARHLAYQAGRCCGAAAGRLPACVCCHLSSWEAQAGTFAGTPAGRAFLLTLTDDESELTLPALSVARTV